MKKLLVIAAFVAAAVSAAAQSRAERILRELRDPQSNYVAVISHRGDWRNYPENSLEALESAIRMGVDIVEIDVHRTADGVLVVCHDKTINRTTSGKGKIAEITYDSISRCCLRSGHNIKMPKYHMPTLAEALDLCRDRVMINIDKGYDYYDQILPMLAERNMVDQVIIKDKKSAAAGGEAFRQVRPQYDLHADYQLFRLALGKTQRHIRRLPRERHPSYRL